MKRLLGIGFERVGRWVLKNEELNFEIERFVDRNNFLYAFISSGAVKYVGKSTKSLQTRMGQYRNPGSDQNTNIGNNRRILETLHRGIDVEIYVLPDNGLIRFGGFHVNTAAALEDDIIRQIDPEWNGNPPAICKTTESHDLPLLNPTLEPNSINRDKDMEGDMTNIRVRQFPGVAVRAWIGCALLQKEDILGSFTPMDIKDRVNDEIINGHMTGPLQIGVYQHAATHNTANWEASPALLKLLSKTNNNTRRRLFLPDDPVHPDRINGPTILDKADELPEQYRPLLKWYTDVFLKAQDLAKADPIPAAQKNTPAP